jgi:Fe-S-cluster-containing hydrogenase component 2
MNPFNGFLVIWTTLEIILFIAFPVLILTFFISIIIYRPYCRFICPFGALANLIGKYSPLKIRRTEHCISCGICEKICPTLESSEFSKKGECYYCNRCIDFCISEMFIDNKKLAQLNRLLTTYSINIDSSSKEKYFEKIVKSIIRLFIPYKREQGFEQLVDALTNKKDMSLDTIQSIVVRLKTNFPEEIKQLDITKYKDWIEQNESLWKKRIEPIHMDKIFYGLKKKAD